MNGTSCTVTSAYAATSTYSCTGADTLHGSTCTRTTRTTTTAATPSYSCPNGAAPLNGQCTGSNSTSTAYIYLAGKQIAETVVGGATQYVHTDALGSPVAHTNQAGAETSRTKFEPYGYTAGGTKPGPAMAGVPTTGSAIGFTGHVNDPETDLVYMQQRYYDPVAGRFLSVDPVVTDANTGGSFNRYAYVNNHPYNYFDPDGRELVAVNLSGIGRTYLDDAFYPKITVFIERAAAGKVELKFTSAFRSTEKQAELKNDKTAITPADKSLHSAGFAVDVNYSSLSNIKGGLTGDQQREVIRQAAKDAGLSWGGNFKKTDPPHFYFDPGRRGELIKDAAKKYDELKKMENQ